MTARDADLRAEIERLTAGADPTPVEPGAVLMPGQWIARWNAASAEERLEQVRHLQGMADRADRCFLLDHEGRLSEEVPMLRQEADRLRAELERADLAGFVFYTTFGGGGDDGMAIAHDCNWCVEIASGSELAAAVKQALKHRAECAPQSADRKEQK